MNAQVLADLHISHCVELTFLEGKLGRCLMSVFLKCSFVNLLHIESESKKRDSIQMSIFWGS